MDPATTIDFARSAMLVLLEIIAPSMLTALVVGLGIGLLQAVTQIQEQTLTFIPKIIVIFLTILFLLPFMINSLTTFTHAMVDRIIAIQ